MKQLTKLSKEELKNLAPQVFNHQVSSKLTDKYVHIPTDIIIEDMENLGWFPYQVKTVKARKSSGKMGKHLIQFFNPDIVINNENGEKDMYPNLLLVNSHDGSTSVRFEMGVFRLVCENGLVIKSKDFGGFKMRHMGYNFEDLRNHINSLVKTLPNVVVNLNKFSQVIMTPEQQNKFVNKAITARFNEEKILPQSEIDFLLTPERKEDEGDNLWVVMNRVQEKLTKGGFGYLNVKGRIRKTRAIKNFTMDTEMNMKLWEIAEEFLVN
jgi:hypothetical protein